MKARTRADEFGGERVERILGNPCGVALLQPAEAIARPLAARRLDHRLELFGRLDDGQRRQRDDEADGGAGSGQQRVAASRESLEGLERERESFERRR